MKDITLVFNRKIDIESVVLIDNTIKFHAPLTLAAMLDNHPCIAILQCEFTGHKASFSPLPQGIEGFSRPSKKEAARSKKMLQEEVVD